MNGRVGAEHYGEERGETAVERAEQIIVEELRRRRWKGEELGRRPKGDLSKVQIAAHLREESIVTVKWIANRLQMGTAGYVNNRLYRWRKGMLGNHVSS